MTSFVFIDGVDGCGKSTFARILRAHLVGAGQQVLALAVDDFRQAIDWAAERDEATAYFERYFDLEALDSVLSALASGANSVAVPSFQEGRPPQRRNVRVPENALVMVEGVFTQRLKFAETRALVYLDLEWALAKERVLVRDQARGRSRQEIQHRINHRYFPAQRRYHERWSPLQAASWIVTRNAQGPDVLARSPGASAAPGLTLAVSMQLDEAIRAALSAPRS